MRAVCEHCDARQPASWVAGDLCTHCGQAVRREVRCFWCVEWTPFGNFCRHCGASVVPEPLFGAARMLKHAGTDRFTVPKQLDALDPDQIANFSRLYQRHAIAMARHVDELAFLERFLHHSHWSAALEEQLVKELPWDKETLERCTGAAIPLEMSLETLVAIEQATPYSWTQQLAQILRLRAGDWDAYESVLNCLYADTQSIRTEAALLLASWRVRLARGLRGHEDAVADVLRDCDFKTKALVRLAALGVDVGPLPDDATDPRDPETAFDAALLRGDADRLMAALGGDPLQCIAAGRALARLQMLEPLVVHLVGPSDLVRNELLDAIALHTSGPVAVLNGALLELIEEAPDRSAQEMAVALLCRACPPEARLRVARAAQGNFTILSRLMRDPTIDVDGATEIALFLIETDEFAAYETPLQSLVERGLIPLAFVPQQWQRANEKTKLALLLMVQWQLGQAYHASLHRFLYTVVFGAEKASVRASALVRLRSCEPEDAPAFHLNEDAIREFAGPFDSFLRQLSGLLQDPQTDDEYLLRDFLQRLLGTAEESFIACTQAQSEAGALFLDSLLGTLKPGDSSYGAEASIQLAGRLGSHRPWNQKTADKLKSLDLAGNYFVDAALTTLLLSLHGIPDPASWEHLPLTFVPMLFHSATAEGQCEWLKVVDHQLVHGPDQKGRETLARWLVSVALSSRDLTVQTRALALFEDRKPFGKFGFSASELLTLFGSYLDLAAALAHALRQTQLTHSPVFLEIVTQILSVVDGALLDEWAHGDERVGQLLEAMEYALNNVESDHWAARAFANQVIKLLQNLYETPRWQDPIAAMSTRLRAAGLVHPELPTPASMVDAPIPADTASEPPPANEDPYVLKARLTEQWAAELQANMMALMSGDGPMDEKLAESARLSAEFQAKMKALYGA